MSQTGMPGIPSKGFTDRAFGAYEHFQDRSIVLYHGLAGLAIFSVLSVWLVLPTFVLGGPTHPMEARFACFFIVFPFSLIHIILDGVF
jgi:hypothetical protein